MSPTDALGHWDWPGAPTLRDADGGLINRSWIVEVSGRPVGVLQRLNTEVFSIRVHEDIEAITAWLEQRGLPTPRLRRTRGGALFVENNGAWRVLSCVGSDTVHKLTSTARAFSAGRLVARFHAAVEGFDWEFRSVRAMVHDTDHHVAAMRAAVDAGTAHRLHPEVAALADAIEARWSRWDGPTDLPVRILHGDLKISNVRFDGDDAVALIDLDTCQWGTLDAELGDAFRSWCNPASEDAEVPRFDLAIFDAAIRGYVAGDPPVSEVEWDSIIPGVVRISLELAARFARDAIEERYFAFDPRFGGHGEHNLLRARGQHQLARTVAHAAPHARRKLDEARATPRR